MACDDPGILHRVSGFPLAVPCPRRIRSHRSDHQRRTAFRSRSRPRQGNSLKGVGTPSRATAPAGSRYPILSKQASRRRPGELPRPGRGEVRGRRTEKVPDRHDRISAQSIVPKGRRSFAEPLPVPPSPRSLPASRSPHRQRPSATSWLRPFRSAPEATRRATTANCLPDRTNRRIQTLDQPLQPCSLLGRTRPPVGLHQVHLHILVAWQLAGRLLPDRVLRAHPAVRSTPECPSRPAPAARGAQLSTCAVRVVEQQPGRAPCSPGVVRSQVCPHAVRVARAPLHANAGHVPDQNGSVQVGGHQPPGIWRKRHSRSFSDWEPAGPRGSRKVGHIGLDLRSVGDEPAVRATPQDFAQSVM